MYEEILKMTDVERNTLSDRLQRLAALPPRGNYTSWLKFYKITVFFALLWYAIIWNFAPDTGVHAFLNDNWIYSTWVLKWWAFFGATVMLNYATIRDEMPAIMFLVCVFPLAFYGASAIIAGLVGAVGLVPSVAHPTVAVFVVLNQMFISSTQRHFAKETLAHQQVLVDKLELDAKNRELQIRIQELEALLKPTEA